MAEDDLREEATRRWTKAVDVPERLMWVAPMQEQSDGSWSPATPLPYLGRTARLEARLRARGWHRLANLLAAWDERRLGRG